MKKPPCDPNCQERTAECKKTCPRWQEYETEHMQELKERAENYERNTDYFAHLSAQVERKKKRRFR